MLRCNFRGKFFLVSLECRPVLKTTYCLLDLVFGDGAGISTTTNCVIQQFEVIEAYFYASLEIDPGSMSGNISLS